MLSNKYTSQLELTMELKQSLLLLMDRATIKLELTTANYQAFAVSCLYILTKVSL